MAIALRAAMTSRLRLVLALICLSAMPATAQTLSWDPSASTGVSGYIVSYGTRSGVYTNSVNVGNQTSWSLTTLDASLNYFLAVRAYTTDGTLSQYSSEVEMQAAAPPGTTVFKSVTASHSYPLLVGQTVTWTASATSKLGAVEYAFWMFSQSTGWVEVQNYSQSATFTWTPGWNDGGTHSFQIWARTVGSSAQYEAWTGVGPFDVNRQPLQLTASTDFPVPPGQPVTWTATAAGVPSGLSLEYKFWLFNQTTNTWSVLAPYGSSNQVTWTPSAVGSYAVQAWARSVGSTSDYDVFAASGAFSIARGNVVISSIRADTSFPTPTGKAITWTTRAHGGTSGPIQYEFWRFKAGEGWTKVQDYSSSNTYTWSPTWGDDGTYAIQVWVRSANSTASFDAWLGTDQFAITAATVQLTTPTAFPAAPGTTVTWSASVSDPSVPVEYEFWIYNGTSGTWSIGRAYSQTATFTWTPTAGKYAVQVWVRRVGTTVSYDAWTGTGLLTVASGPLVVQRFTSSVVSPMSAGTQTTWTATATGGTAGPLQYEFWVRAPDGTWTLAQAYSTSNTFNWTPTVAGTYSLQVWARSAGSTASMEAWLGSGTFTIQ
jgi:N-acetylmuramoyl-L-alanine amidase